MKTLNINSAKQTLREVKVGEGVRIYDFVNAYECTIGSGTQVGAFVEIQKNVVIGQKCKISSHSFLCEGVHLGDGVFVGHGVVFVNDKYPRALNDQGELQSEDQWQKLDVLVEDGASIGSGSVILGGVRIGRDAMVGAGSVVTKDVLPGTIVVGNPARPVRSF